MLVVQSPPDAISVFAPVVTVPLVKANTVLTVTFDDRLTPLALFVVKLPKLGVPTIDCALVPLNVHTPLPALKVPLLLKLPFKATAGLLVLPAKVVLATTVKLPRISSVPEAGVLVLPPETVRFG